MNRKEILTSIKIADSFFDLALLFEKYKKYDLAIENYKKALEYDSNFKLAKANIDRLHTIAS